MPRTARASVGGMCYHVLNRGNGRAEVFHKEDDDAAFLKLLCQASKRVPMRLLAYCLIGQTPKVVERPRLDIGPAGRAPNWLRLVNAPQSEAEVAALRESIARGSPSGSVDWKHETAGRLGPEYTLHPRGRARKGAEK